MKRVAEIPRAEIISMSFELQCLEIGMEIRAKRRTTPPMRTLVRSGDKLGTDS